VVADESAGAGQFGWLLNLLRRLSDEELSRLYHGFRETGKVQPYLRDAEEGEGEPFPPAGFRVRRPDRKARELPEIVARANQSLRAAANHLCLAFHEDNRLLFMGDLEYQEILQVVTELERKHRTHFAVIIAPHHGTHWHPALRRLTAHWVASSLGDRLIGNFRKELKSIGNICLATHTNGSIHVPGHFGDGPYVYSQRRPWLFRSSRRR